MGELHIAQLAVAHLRRFDLAEDVLARAVGVVDDDLDRVDALGHASSGRASMCHKLGQLGAQAIVERLVERSRTRRRSCWVRPSRSSTLIVTCTHPQTSRPARYARPRRPLPFVRRVSTALAGSRPAIEVDWLPATGIRMSLL